MKKSIIFMAGLVGLALSSCDDKSDLGVMQKNEAPVIVPTDGVAIKSIYASSGNSVNLQNYEESVYVPLIDIALSTDFPASSVVTGEVEIADNADFNNAVTMALTSSEVGTGNAAVAAAVRGETRNLQGVVEMTSWEDAFTSFYGLNPNPNVNYLRYKLWLSNDSQRVILYNQDGSEWWDAMEFTVTPLDAKLDVAPAYTLFYTTGGEEYSLEMYHNPAKHVYDDPTFSASIEVAENSVIEWWVAPSDNLGQTYGVDGTDPITEDGTLALISEGAIKGQIDNAGVYKLEVNMLERTFSVKLAPPSLYVMSTSGVNFDNVAQLGTEDNVNYSGMAGLLAQWGLAGQAAYVPTLYVNNPDVERTSEGGTYTGGLLFDTSGNPLNSTTAIPYPGTGAGLYYITANLQSMTYTGYQCKKVGLVGSFNNWGNANDDGSVTPDTELKGSRTTLYMEWTGNITLAENDEWKIRMNSEWTVDFGLAEGSSFTADGSSISLAKGGANIVATEAGEFTVTVYFRRYLDENGKMTPYYMTIKPVSAE